jgi:inorganic pyrophosphatase
LIPTLWLAGYLCLPDRIVGLAYTERTHWYAFYCCVFGLVSGLVIGLITEFYTSKSQAPVIEIAAASTNPAMNIILGIALGNYSVVIPVVCLAITAYFAHIFMGMFGVALAALGMLSNLTISLAIDGYGPVSDNGGGIAEMCNLPE